MEGYTKNPSNSNKYYHSNASLNKHVNRANWSRRDRQFVEEVRSNVGNFDKEVSKVMPYVISQPNTRKKEANMNNWKEEYYTRFGNVLRLYGGFDDLRKRWKIL